MDIKISELSTDQINDIRKQLEEFDSKPKRWKPEDGNRYYYLDSMNRIYHDDFYCNRVASRTRAGMNNLFQTRELAEAEVERRQIIAELQIYALEHNDEIDWSAVNTAKWYIMRDVDGYIRLDCAFSHRIFGVVYFSSDQIAQGAIEAIGEDRLLKLFV